MFIPAGNRSALKNELLSTKFSKQEGSETDVVLQYTVNRMSNRSAPNKPFYKKLFSQRRGTDVPKITIYVYSCGKPYRPQERVVEHI